MRIPIEEFRRKPLRVHRFLDGVPLHDVWLLRLRGGGPGRQIREVWRLLAETSLQQAGPLVRSLFALRSWLGRLLGWDHPRHHLASPSYAGRLDPGEAGGRPRDPDRTAGPFRLLYDRGDEALGEVVNGTVHAFLAMTMEPTPTGYTVYWAVYVKGVNWFSPFYMALIDPFRRYLVYPSLIRRMEAAWVRAHRDGAREVSSLASGQQRA